MREPSASKSEMTLHSGRKRLIQGKCTSENAKKDAFQKKHSQKANPSHVSEEVEMTELDDFEPKMTLTNKADKINENSERTRRVIEQDETTEL